MVMIRSSSPMQLDRTLSSVVLPDPVPPHTTMFSRACTQAVRKSATGGVSEPNLTKSSIVRRLLLNFRMVMHGPAMEIGGMTTFTREAVGKTRIDQWIVRVEMLAKRFENAVNHFLNVRVVVKRDVRAHRLAGALHINPVGTIDHDLGDAGVFQQRLDWTEGEEIIQNLLQNLGADVLGESRVGGLRALGSSSSMAWRAA